MGGVRRRTRLPRLNGEVRRGGGGGSVGGGGVEADQSRRKRPGTEEER